MDSRNCRSLDEFVQEEDCSQDHEQSGWREKVMQFLFDEAPADRWDLLNRYPGYRSDVRRTVDDLLEEGAIEELPDGRLDLKTTEIDEVEDLEESSSVVFSEDKDSVDDTYYFY